MIFFKIKKLEEDLAHDRVTPTVGFRYFLFSTVIITISTYLPHEPYENDLLNFVEFFISLVITIYGTVLTFNTNNIGDKKDYLLRFISLSFVIGLRLLVFFTVIYIILFIALYFFLESMFENILLEEIMDVSIMIVVLIVYFLQINKSLKNIHSIQLAKTYQNEAE